jgi:ABC-type transporter Mla subunit MlaD
MNVIQALKSERDRLRQVINRLNAAISALGGSASTVRTTVRKRPTLSAAARARIAAAQRARWAKVRAKKAGKAK